MGAALGAAFRDEAKANVPVREGKLRDAMYVALDTDLSTDTRVVYTVSWNRQKAFYGHFLEFGWTQVNVQTQLSDGTWITLSERLDTPIRRAAKPFMRPALGTVMPRSMRIAAAAGRKRLEELLNGGE